MNWEAKLHKQGWKNKRWAKEETTWKYSIVQAATPVYECSTLPPIAQVIFFAAWWDFDVPAFQLISVATNLPPRWLLERTSALQDGEHKSPALLWTYTQVSEIQHHRNKILAQKEYEGVGNTAFTLEQKNFSHHLWLHSNGCSQNSVQVRSNCHKIKAKCVILVGSVTSIPFDQTFLSLSFVLFAETGLLWDSFQNCVHPVTKSQNTTFMWGN